MVSHNSEAMTDVDNCNDPGCYSKSIHYVGATIKQLTTLVDLSTTCQQFFQVFNSLSYFYIIYFNELIQYDCFGAPFEFNGEAQSWWNDRNGVQRYFWAGTNNKYNQHTCQCGIDNNCVDTKSKCNCDSLTFKQLTDKGIYHQLFNNN